MPETELHELHPYREIDFSGIETELEDVEKNEQEGIYRGKFRVRDNIITLECRKKDNGWDVSMTDSQPIPDLWQVHHSTGIQNLKFALQGARSAVEAQLAKIDRLHPSAQRARQDLSPFGNVGDITVEEVPGRVAGFSKTRYEGKITMNGIDYLFRAEVDHTAGTPQYPDVLPWTVRLERENGSITRESGHSLQEIMAQWVQKYSV